MKEAVTKVIDTLTRGLPWGLPEDVGTVQQVDCRRRRLLRSGLEFHVLTINKSAHTKKVWKLIEGTSYIYICVCVCVCVCDISISKYLSIYIYIKYMISKHIL